MAGRTLRPHGAAGHNCARYLDGSRLQSFTPSACLHPDLQPEPRSVPVRGAAVGVRAARLRPARVAADDRGARAAPQPGGAPARARPAPAWVRLPAATACPDGRYAERRQYLLSARGWRCSWTCTPRMTARPNRSGRNRRHPARIRCRLCPRLSAESARSSNSHTQRRSCSLTSGFVATASSNRHRAAFSRN